MASSGTVDSGDGVDLLSVTLATLDRKHQLQLASLAVFPSGFDQAAAAAVLGVEVGQAEAALKVLYGHGLVLHDTAKGQHYLHMAVREASRRFKGVDKTIESSKTR